MIVLDAVSKTFKTKHHTLQALNNVSLSIAQGEIFGIIGRSGAGKSTLIRCVNLLEKPSSGRVMLHDRCLMSLAQPELRAARQKMGMIFQHFNLLNSRNVQANIALPLELAHHSRQFIQTRVNELLALTQLEEYANAYPNQLSGGQKQRVAIARALATEPEILLCDEATSALDPQSTLAILDLLRTINHQLGITILLITHEMDVVKAICHRAAVMHAGEVVETNSVINLFSRPQSPLTRALVNATLRLNLPAQLHSNGNKALLRLAYHGQQAQQPLISQLIKDYQLTINILQGTIETIQNQTVGVLIVEAIAPPPIVQAGIDFLLAQGIQVEVLGYVD